MQIRYYWWAHRRVKTYWGHLRATAWSNSLVHEARSTRKIG